MSGAVACLTCHEIFKEADEIMSTYCGHVYHARCVQGWLERSATCPQCRATNPSTHKLYLKFEEATDSDTDLNSIKSQLVESVMGTSELQHQLETTERELFTLQQNFFKTVDGLEDKVQYLKVQNDARELEIKSLNDKNPNFSTEKSSKTADNGTELVKLELEICQRKLKLITEQLELEIQNSTNLTSYNAKLKSKLNQYEKISANAPTTANAIVYHNLEYNSNNNSYLLKNSTGAIPKIPTAITETLPVAKTVSSAEIKVPLAVTPNQQLKDENLTAMTSIIIRNLNENDAAVPPNQFIFMLAKYLDIQLLENEIKSTYLLDARTHMRRNMQTKSKSLVIVFNNLDKKIEFLKNKKELKKNPLLKHLIMCEYVDDEQFSLFHYAKILKTIGYNFIFCKNNTVNIKRNMNSAVTVITSKEQVDKLVKDFAFVEGTRTHAREILQPYEFSDDADFVAYLKALDI